MEHNLIVSNSDKIIKLKALWIAGSIRCVLSNCWCIFDFFLYHVYDKLQSKAHHNNIETHNIIRKLNHWSDIEKSKKKYFRRRCLLRESKISELSDVGQDQQLEQKWETGFALLWSYTLCKLFDDEVKRAKTSENKKMKELEEKSRSQSCFT